MFECEECGREYPSQAAAARCCEDGDGYGTEPFWVRGTE